MGSTRLPGKVMELVNGKPIIQWQLERILRSKRIQKLIVAIPEGTQDDLLAEFLKQNGYLISRGSLNNVFQRFVGALSVDSPSNFVRITADCPLIMSEILDNMILEFQKREVDYLSNALEHTFPDGLDLEIVKTDAFLKLQSFELSVAEQEHVTLGLYSRSQYFKVSSYSSGLNLGSERWTLDYPEDLRFISKVYDFFKGRETEFTLSEVIELLTRNPGIRNELAGELRNIALKRTFELGSDNERTL
ncbi:SpsF Spore coat polysaccharide biosynthesis protein F, CMP-KDO synthetase homolog [Candidatus Nanopelagicaceae bacterium]